MRAVCLLVGMLSVAGCLEERLPVQRWPHPHLDPPSTVMLSSTGELILELARHCLALAKTLGGYVAVPCSPSDRDRVVVTAMTPWQQTVKGRWIDNYHVVFLIDWARSGLDSLADDAAHVAMRPWTISSTSSISWQPSPSDVARILDLVGKATQTEPDLVRGGPAPLLEVIAVEIAEGALISGGESTLVVRVANRGLGTAYRVVATTRSSIPSLHGRRLSFGMIKSNADKTRRLRVTIPLSETAPDAMLVLALGEGNGFTPRNTSRRIPIRASATAPVLAVRCMIAGRTATMPEVDAGENIVLHCLVDNTGTIAAPVVLDAAVPKARAVASPAQSVAVGAQAAFDVPLTIPRDLALDATIEIVVLARDTVYSRAARTTVTAVVRKPKMCGLGQLTRSQYDAKIAEIRAARAAGDLTQAQFDRYDAELVSCLQ